MKSKLMKENSVMKIAAASMVALLLALLAVTQSPIRLNNQLVAEHSSFQKIANQFSLVSAQIGSQLVHNNMGVTGDTGPQGVPGTIDTKFILAE